MPTLLKDVFLTREERENIAHWKYACVDNSITTKISTPFWNFCVRFVPATVAPNIISLAGLICILYFFNLAFNYADEKPAACSFAGVCLVFTYMTLDAIDGKHARNTGNSSPLGELFDHSCDNVSVPFLVMGFTLCMGVTDTTINWYMVQTIQILFLLSHVDAFCKRVVEFGMFTSPGEAIYVYLGLLTANGFGYFGGFELWFTGIAQSYDMTSTQLGILIFSSMYYMSWICFVLYVATMASKHNVTKKGLMVCILVRTVPALLIYWGLVSDKLSIFSVIADGVIMAVLTGDMIVAKMASRDLHPLVPILLMLSIFDNFLCFAGALYYYCVVLYEISMHLRIPIFGVKRVVFINGVFDLFHRAHLRLVKAAAAEGTYLIVGVLSEEDVLTYKPKRPAMTYQQRFDALKDCAYVDHVIQSPLYIRGEEGDRFLEKHKIDLIVCSSEYDNTEDEYYESSRRQGKLHILERMDGISTSKLKHQVFERCSKDDD